MTDDTATPELRRALARALGITEDDDRMPLLIQHGQSIGPRDGHGRLNPLATAQKVKDSAIGQNVTAKPKETDPMRHARAMANMTPQQQMEYARKHGLT